MTHTTSTTRGFTLIELLVVIAIIGLLSSVVLASLSTARAKARDSKRLSDLHQLQLAVELYANDNGSFPSTGGNVRGNCTNMGGYANTGGALSWIPNLAPTYISTLPTESYWPLNGSKCYLYMSNGTDYMLMAFQSVEGNAGAANPAKRPAESSTGYTSYAIYTAGAVGW